MAAIQRHVLARQLQELAAAFESPPRFRTALLEILDFYADHTLRVRSAKETTPRLREFHVPPLLVRELEKFLAPMTRTQPEQALQLADTLWAEPCLETRRLAAWMLGQVPVHPPDEVVDRLNRWCEQALDDAVLKALARRGVARLRKDAPQVFLAQLETWLTEGGERKVRLGLYVLQGWVDEGAEAHAPAIFRWLAPHLRSPERALSDALQDALEALIVALPRESAFFLQELLASTPRRELVALCRRVLSVFPPDEARALGALLRDLRRTDRMSSP